MAVRPKTRRSPEGGAYVFHSRNPLRIHIACFRDIGSIAACTNVHFVNTIALINLTGHVRMNDKDPIKTKTHEIITFEDGDPNENPWVLGAPETEHIEVVPYDKAWPALFNSLSQRIASAPGIKALEIAHVGSTAVPGLSAKPVIDIDMIVDDPEDEASYIPALTAIGYRHRVREPSWYQHRMLRLDTPRVNLHIFGPDCPEHLRHLLFRDWLSGNPQDRRLYEEAKTAALSGAATMQQYNMNKQQVVREIYQRIFAHNGWLPEN